MIETETEIKLADARMQLDLADSHIDDGAVVRSCINAFISLARSVTFVMQVESGSSTPLRSWYDQEMAALKDAPLMRYFHEQRTVTIHRGNVKVDQKRFAVLSPQRLGKAAVLSPQFMDCWTFDRSTQPPPHAAGSALNACRQYLEMLDALVAAWLEQRSAPGP